MPVLPRSISLLGAAGVMIGVIIGSGIFATPAVIAQSLDSPLLILGLWLLGGVLALFGALTFAELVTMFPQSGGTYVVLREGYGRAPAFIFGWTYMLIVKPSAAAGIAVIFASNLNLLLGTTWDHRVVVCVMIFVLTLINWRGTALSARFATFLTAIKVLALVAIVAVAAIFGHYDAAHFKPTAEPSAIPFWQGIIAVMAAILWTYDGWGDVGAVAGEVKNPQRNLPLAFLLGTLGVTVLYVLVNAAYFYVLTMPQMRGASELSVAQLTVSTLFSPQAALVITGVAVLSTIGSTHASIMTGARVSYAQSSDGLMFRFLSHVHPRYQTPDVALWVQAVLSCTAVIWLQTFGKLAGAFVFTMWIFYGLAAATIFIFRIKRPDHPRPYKCWGYPVVPAIFILAAAAMTVASIVQSPRETLPWLGLLAAGWPIYHLWTRLTARADARQSSPPNL